MASTLFVQMESRMRRRAMMDLIDDLTIEARKKAGIEYITVPSVEAPHSLSVQMLPQAHLPIVPAKLRHAKSPMIQFGWPVSE
jgi:hypothetical protein